MARNQLSCHSSERIGVVQILVEGEFEVFCSQGSIRLLVGQRKYAFRCAVDFVFG